MDDLELMRLQVEALFHQDANDRLLGVNDVGSPPAPRFFLGHTAAGSIFRLRFDLPDELQKSLAALVSDLTVSEDAPSSSFAALVSEAFGSLERFEQVLAALEAHAPIRKVQVGPAYYFPTEPTAIPPLASEAIQISPQNEDVLYAELRDWVPGLAARQPCFAMARDGRAVAICASSRLTPRAAEAGVETIAEYRGQGLGAAVVAAWAARVRNLGLLPLYSTAWDNLASQGVARRLGLVRYGIDVSID